MTVEIETRAAAALDRWASAMEPRRPPLDELLARHDAPVEALPVRPPGRRGRWLVAAAAAVVVVVGVSVVVAVTRRGSGDDRQAPPISQVTTESSSTVPVSDAQPAGFAPGSIPAGYRVSAADVWVPSQFELPVTGEVWLRRGPDGAVVGRIAVDALRVAPDRSTTGIPPPADGPHVHGLPAYNVGPDTGSAEPRAAVAWEEAGLHVTVTASDDSLDVLALAEQTQVGPDGVVLADAAVPEGFLRVPRDQQATSAVQSSSVMLVSDDVGRSISVTSRPNTLGQTIDALVEVGALPRAIHGRQIAMTATANGVRRAQWIDGGVIVSAGAPDEAALVQLVETVEPADQATFDDLADQAAATWQAVPEQDAVVFPDGLRVALHVSALQGEAIPAAPWGAICVEADRVRCGSRSVMSADGSNPWTLRHAEALISVEGRLESFVWVHHPATEIRRVVRRASGEPVPYQAIAGDHGVVVRATVPDNSTNLLLAAWLGDGDRGVGGGGFTTWLDTGRQSIVADVSTSEIEAPPLTGFFLPTVLPDGFVIEDAGARPPDLTVHEPISQDYWVRRNDASITTDWLSLVATRSDGGEIAAADANLTINELPANIQTDAAGLTTITWYENDQRVTATSTMDPGELATNVEFVSVDPDGGGAWAGTPLGFEHVDRGAAIVAAEPLAVTTTVELQHASGAGVAIRISPNTNGASFDTLPPRGQATYTSIGPDLARITHVEPPAVGTNVEWVTNGFLVEVSSTGVSDEALLAIAAGIRPTDRAGFESVAGVGG